MLGRKLALPSTLGLAALLMAACASPSQVSSSSTSPSQGSPSSPQSTAAAPSESLGSPPAPSSTVSTSPATSPTATPALSQDAAVSGGQSSAEPETPGTVPAVDAEALRSQTLPVALKVLEFAVESSRASRGIDVSDPDPAVYSSLRKSASAWIGAARKAQRDLPDPVQSVLLDGTPLTEIKSSDVSPRDGVTVAVLAGGTMCSIRAVPLPEAAAWAWEGPECVSVTTKSS